ncbi:DUF2316 family protein [Lentilactobacillus sp. Marseille-Q4993]|uniref:DUF2316 family protein n=1 Tax=Lentilactobacillus sp. Marseille-Q4993 TaxID=3039492 RepID=UPI0024BC8138|nr:DUF2316 family protein [Lentilactobacillus sp. Marseille-Q4993]
MTLTPEEQSNTRIELQRNFDLADITLADAARDLNTTPEHVDDVLKLHSRRIEEPWVLKNYLNRIIKDNGDTPYPYSKLAGSPMLHMFLDQKYIRRGKLDEEPDLSSDNFNY